MQGVRGGGVQGERIQTVVTWEGGGHIKRKSRRGKDGGNQGISQWARGTKQKGQATT